MYEYPRDASAGQSARIPHQRQSSVSWDDWSSMTRGSKIPHLCGSLSSSPLPLSSCLLAICWRFFLFFIFFRPAGHLTRQQIYESLPCQHRHTCLRHTVRGHLRLWANGQTSLTADSRSCLCNLSESIWGLRVLDSQWLWSDSAMCMPTGVLLMPSWITDLHEDHQCVMSHSPTAAGVLRDERVKSKMLIASLCA